LGLQTKFRLFIEKTVSYFPCPNSFGLFRFVYELACKTDDAIPHSAKAISLCKSCIESLKNSKDVLAGKEMQFQFRDESFSLVYYVTCCCVLSTQANQTL
jgi:hypothetical protein